MFFMNVLFFVGFLEEVDYRKFDCVRNILEDELQDLDWKKLVNLLGTLDDLYSSFRTQDISHIVDKTKFLSEDIFQLIKEKMFHDVIKL